MGKPTDAHDVALKLTRHIKAQPVCVFEALSNHAREISMAPGGIFLAERFAKFTDQFGTPRMVNFLRNKATDPRGSDAR